MAAVSGVSFSSGREVALFFSQTGRASWLGVVCAAVLFGLLCAGICRLCEGGKGAVTDGFRTAGSMAGSIAASLYGLFASFAAFLMLQRAGRLAMLALPVHNALQVGMTAALAAALVLNMRNQRWLPRVGCVILAASIAFHICMMLDRRPVPMVIQYETRAALEGSSKAALILAVLHASLSAAAAAGAASKYAEKGVRPVRFGMKCAALMLAVLACANGAILSGGRKMLSLQLPGVALAARWGTAGFYMIIVVESLCCIASLASFLNALGDCFAAIVKGLKHDKIMC